MALAKRRVHLIVRLSKPVARLTVTVRRARTGSRRQGRLVSRQVLGARPVGYHQVSLRAAARLAPGRYRVSIQAVDRDRRRSARATVLVGVVRRSR